jgi:hypothetical protein
MGFTAAEPTIFEDRNESRSANEFLIIPQFGYPGGKAKPAKRIVGLLPPSGDRSFEVFAGRANLFCGLGNIFWPNDIRTSEFFAAIALPSHIDKVFL